jgi:uncharacterized membrane protein
MVEETTIAVNIALATMDLRVADNLMKKMLKTLNFEELELIKGARVSKTVSEVEMSSDVFDEVKTDGC